MDAVGVFIMLSEAMKNDVGAAEATFGLVPVMLCFRRGGDSEDEPPPSAGRMLIYFDIYYTSLDVEEGEMYV